MRTILLMLLFTAMLFAACDAPKEPVFQSLKNVKVSSVGITNGLTVNLAGEAVFNNPNPIGVDVSGMDIDVFVNGKKVSEVHQNLTAAMEGNADFTLPLNFKIPLKDIINDVKGGLIKDLLKKKKVDIKLDGTIKVKMGGVDVKVPFDYEEVHEI